jgi:hypothetical protein
MDFILWNNLFLNRKGREERKETTTFAPFAFFAVRAKGNIALPRDRFW